MLTKIAGLTLLFMSVAVAAAAAERVVDVPSRDGVTQRFLVVAAQGTPKAAVVLFAGGHGGLQLAADGALGWGKGNFLVRSRELFAGQGLLVAVIDAPSDRQGQPFLSGFRQTPSHVSDVKAVIGWLRREAKVPVWLVGTSRGTQSAAFVGTELPVDQGGPDGIVLTSSVLRDPRGRPVPDMPLDRIAVPVLVVHHKRDGCAACPYEDVPRVMTRLGSAPARELLTFDGGVTRGDPCEAFAYHGFNGLERDVVSKIAVWILTH